MTIREQMEREIQAALANPEFAQSPPVYDMATIWWSGVAHIDEQDKEDATRRAWEHAKAIMDILDDKPVIDIAITFLGVMSMIAACMRDTADAQSGEQLAREMGEETL